MAKTYQQLLGEIETLRQRAEQVRSSELAGVIERIKVAIDHYGLTAQDLGLTGTPGRAGKAGRSGAPSTKAASSSMAGKSPKSAGTAQFQDGNGNQWSGRGPRPTWVKAALAAGRSLDEFRSASTADAPSTSNPSKPAAKKVSLPAKFRDETGNAWSGRGSTPRWVKAALDGGKTLDDLRV